MDKEKSKKNNIGHWKVSISLLCMTYITDTFQTLFPPSKSHRFQSIALNWCQLFRY